MKFDNRKINNKIRESEAWKTEMNETTADVLEEYGFNSLGDFLNKEVYMFLDLEGFSVEDVVHTMRFILDTAFPGVHAKENEWDEDDYELDPEGDSTAFFPDKKWDEITVEDLICNPFVDFYTIEEAVYEIAEFFYYSDYYDIHEWHYADKNDMEQALKKYRNEQ